MGISSLLHVFTAVPSAMVFALESVTGCLSFNASVILAAAAGSTPITFTFGFRSFVSVDTPVISPPPPIVRGYNLHPEVHQRFP